MNRLATCLGIIAILGFIAACGPLGDGDESAQPDPSSTATSGSPATLPPMQIVTRTPVDPAQIPPTPSGTPTDIEVPSTYIVQEGDSLYSIANRFQLDLAEIVALNGLSDPNDITVGQELTLPAPEEE